MLDVVVALARRMTVWLQQSTPDNDVTVSAVGCHG